MTWFAVHDLNIDFDRCLYEVPVSAIVLMLNCSAIAYDNGQMSLSEREFADKLCKLEGNIEQRKETTWQKKK